MKKSPRLQLNGLGDLGSWESVCAYPENLRENDKRLVLLSRLKTVHLVAMSFCGVLTPPYVYLGEDGEKLLRCSQRDLLAVELLNKYGYRVIVISNRRTKVVELRCHKMGVSFVTADTIAKDKGKAGALRHTLQDNHIFENQTLYIGDDLNDLEVMGAANLAIATRDADKHVREAADYITSAPGGEHAVREVAELLLMANGHELKL